MLHQKIRSFVRRQGRMSEGQKKAFVDIWPRYGLNPQTKIDDIDVLFGRVAPKILEIGFGMGQSLIALAHQYPEYDFIGIEVHRPGVGSVLEQIEKNQLTNLRLFCEDAVKILTDCIPNQSLAKILILFPDPWQKKRHHKRRLIQPTFVELLRKKLISEGILHIATDWENYAEHIQAVFAQQSGFELVDNMGDFMRFETKYEQRGKRLGHTIYDFRFKNILY